MTNKSDLEVSEEARLYLTERLTEAIEFIGKQAEYIKTLENQRADHALRYNQFDSTWLPLTADWLNQQRKPPIPKD